MKHISVSYKLWLVLLLFLVQVLGQRRSWGFERRCSDQSSCFSLTDRSEIAGTKTEVPISFRRSANEEIADVEKRCITNLDQIKKSHFLLNDTLKSEEMGMGVLAAGSTYAQLTLGKTKFKYKDFVIKTIASIEAKEKVIQSMRSKVSSSIQTLYYGSAGLWRPLDSVDPDEYIRFLNKLWEHLRNYYDALKVTEPQSSKLADIKGAIQNLKYAITTLESNWDYHKIEKNISRAKIPIRKLFGDLDIPEYRRLNSFMEPVYDVVHNIQNDRLSVLEKLRKMADEDFRNPRENVKTANKKLQLMTKGEAASTFLGRALWVLTVTELLPDVWDLRNDIKAEFTEHASVLNLNAIVSFDSNNDPYYKDSATICKAVRDSGVSEEILETRASQLFSLLAKNREKIRASNEQSSFRPGENI